MNTPVELKYAQTHEWVSFLPDGKARIGLTDFAQNALGDIVFVNLPATGDSLTAQQSLGDVESVKSVSDILSPLTGTVTAVNEALLDDPGLINREPYESWLIELDETGAREELMDAAAYEAFCKEA